MAVALLLASLLLPLAHGAIESLYDTTLEERVEEADVLLVMFYDPLSARCQQFEPTFAAAAVELEEDSIPLARVDAAMAHVSARRYGVTETPRLVVFRGGEAYHFRAKPEQLTSAEVVTYMQRQAELARTASPASLDLAWQALADEIARLHEVRGAWLTGCCGVPCGRACVASMQPACVPTGVSSAHRHYRARRRGATGEHG